MLVSFSLVRYFSPSLAKKSVMILLNVPVVISTSFGSFFILAMKSVKVLAPIVDSRIFKVFLISRHCLDMKAART